MGNICTNRSVRNNLFAYESPIQWNNNVIDPLSTCTSTAPQIDVQLTLTVQNSVRLSIQITFDRKIRFSIEFCMGVH